MFAVHTIVERLKEKTNNLLKDADNLYKTALIKLPMAVRKMNWIEYCSKNVFHMYYTMYNFFVFQLLSEFLYSIHLYVESRFKGICLFFLIVEVFSFAY